jgi:branched-chain amino acid transport system substrate-binding protein
VESNGTQAVKDASAAPSVEKIFTGDGMCFGEGFRGLSADVLRRIKCTIAPLDPEAYGAAGRAFFADYRRRFGARFPDPYAIYGYEAMSLLLDSLDRASDGGGSKVSRQAVVDALFETKDRDSVLGTYSIDANGDTSIKDYGLYALNGRQLVFDRVLRP